MKSVYVISLFFVSTFQVINCNLFEGMQDWLENEFESQLEVRSPLPNTGYWNFLLIAGIYGRMAHFLLTDDRGFGEQIKNLDYLFKEEFGDEYYISLEGDVAESFPLSDAIFDGTLMMLKVRDIRDPITKKTLGDAFRTLRNIADDRGCVQQIVKRWNMIDDVSSVFKNQVATKPAIDDAEFNRLKTLLLEHPETFQRLLTQPDVLNRLSGSVLESLKDIDLIKGVESIQEMALLLKTLYPRNYDHISQQLLEIKDEQSGLSFAEGLETISNVMKMPEFQHRLRKLLRTNFLQDVHDVSQIPLATAMGEHHPKEAINGADPAKVRRYLAIQEVYMSEEKAESLIEDARNGRLLDTIKRTVQNAEQSVEGLTAESISQSFAAEGIKVSPEKVKRFMALMQMFSSRMIITNLRSMGIEATQEDVNFLKQKAMKVAPQTWVPPVRQRTKSPSVNVDVKETPA